MCGLLPVLFHFCSIVLRTIIAQEVHTLIAGKVIGSTYQAILPACATTMSSEPVASAETTPPTSPETRDNGLTEAMQKEEEQMAKAREKEDAKHERKLAA